MSIFLVSLEVGRSYSSGAAGAGTVSLEASAARLSETCSRWIGPKYSSEPSIYTDTGNGDLFGIVWEGGLNSHSSIKRGGGRVVFSSDPFAAAGLHLDVNRVGGRLTYSRPVWGVYSAIYYERNERRLTAWCTSPSLETIYYGICDDRIYLSNRAILVAEALKVRGQRLVGLNSEFYPEFLLYGYSITGATPFAGVQVLDNNCSIVAGEKGYAFEEIPPGLNFGLHPSHSLEEGAEALATSLRESAVRCIERTGSSGLELRLSAGKDSRVLLGLLRELDVSGYAVTFGRSAGDPEVELASQLADLAGFPHVITSPKFAPGESIRDRSLWNLRNAGGLPLSESHGLIYRGAEPRVLGDGLMLGQWPLMKGGLAKRLKMAPGKALQSVRSQGSQIVKSSVRRPFDDYLTDWFYSCSAQNDIERLYMFSRQFRSGRWLQATIALYSQESELVYPISDSAVTSVADTLSLAEKISDKALFFALQDIWPSSFNLPFSSSAWRFPMHEFLGSSASEALSRYVRKVSPSSSVSSTVRTVTPEYSGANVSAIAGEILSSSLGDDLGDLLSNEFLRVVEEAAAGRIHVLEDATWMRTAQLMWRVYALTLLDSLDWYS